MVRMRILAVAVLAAGLTGASLGVALGQWRRTPEQPGMRISRPSPTCSVDAPRGAEKAPTDMTTYCRTIRVPVFKNAVHGLGFARGMEMELTGAVIRQIEMTTPYKVVAADEPADTELTGTVTGFTKQFPPGDMAANVSDNREAETRLVVEVTWRDLRSGENLLRHKDESAPATAVLQSSAFYRPELEEPLDKPRHKNIADMAQKIISLMETPW